MTLEANTTYYLALFGEPSDPFNLTIAADIINEGDNNLLGTLESGESVVYQFAAQEGDVEFTFEAKNLCIKIYDDEELNRCITELTESGSVSLSSANYYIEIVNTGKDPISNITLKVQTAEEEGEGEKTATILFNEYNWEIPHAAFVGSWTTDEINAKIKSGKYDNGDLEDDKLGLVDLTGVTLENLGSISTPNPNTIIEISESQSISNTANVLVNGVVANLVITDPLTTAGSQNLDNYSKVNCGFYYSGDDFTATKASYTRPMSSTYATVMIPFYFDSAAQNATIMDITNIDENGVEIEPTEYVEISFGRPFIAKVTDGDLKITAENTTVAGSYGGINSMFGVYTEITLGEGDYYIAQDQFWNAGSYEDDVILKPFRCYITLPEVNEVKIAIKENATAIKTVNSEQMAVNNGKFIENGKVVVVKNGEKFNLNGQRVR